MYMICRLAMLYVLMLQIACSNDAAPPIEPGPLEPRPFSTDQLTELVEATRQDFGSPGLGVLIQIGSDPPLVSVSGVRKLGSEVAIEKSDMWYIGSAAKAMTSTLLATYVEDGSVEFDTTLIEIFPEYTGKFTNAARMMTVANLLSHSAGLPPNPAASRDELAELMGDIEDLGQQRKRVLEEFVSKDLLFAPGSDYSYSNTGYIIAAAVIERIGGQSFETLLSDRVFEPLGITEFGFGHPAAANPESIIDQPWGHHSSLFRLVPVSPADAESINPPIFNSAGNLHISLGNWSIFVGDQIKGRAGEGRLFRQQLYECLQMPGDGETGYSLGWGVLVEAGKPIMLTHNGSDGNWFADVRAYPPTNLILLVTTNDGREDDEAKAAAAYIRKEFRKRYNPTP